MKKQFSDLFPAQSLLLPLITPLVVIILFVASWPLVSRAKQSWDELDQFSKIVTALTTKRDQLNRADKTFISASVATGLRALPTKSAIISALVRVEEVAKQYNVTLSQTQVSETSDPSNPISSAALKIEAQGSLDVLLPFLGEVERSFPFIRAQGGNFSIDEDATRQARVTLVTYWKDLPTKLPDITEPLPVLSPSETELLSKLSGFQSRSVSLPVTPPGEIQPRSNPFAF